MNNPPGNKPELEYITLPDMAVLDQFTNKQLMHYVLARAERRLVILRQFAHLAALGEIDD